MSSSQQTVRTNVEAVVSNYNPSKGWGFVQTADKDQTSAFAHFRNIQGDVKFLQKGQRVTCDIIEVCEDGDVKYQAYNINRM